MELFQQQYITVQKYICSIFGDMPKIVIKPQQSIQTTLNKCMQQNMLYGRKLIQMSEKFTAKYRKQNALNHKDIQNKILLINNIVNGNKYHDTNIDQMIDRILTTVQQMKLQQDSLKRSKLSQVSENQQPSIDRKKSVTNKNKSQYKRQDGFTTKKVLQIKGFFQQQENHIREIYDKFRKISEQYRVNLSQQKTKFIKTVNDNETDNLLSFIKANVSNNIQNINKIQELLQWIIQGFNKKIQNEGLAESRLVTYQQQLQRRQDVYSYAVSKLLQNLNILRISVNKQQEKSNVQQSRKITNLINNLQDIGQKFYEMYPSVKIMNDLQPLKIKVIKCGTKSQHVQVNLINRNIGNIQRQNNSDKNLQLYKLNIRITQILERFEKAIKHKKQIECKQIQKFIINIKENLPKKNQNITNQLEDYQQQLKTIMQQNENIQKQLSQDYNKKSKKYEKRINELQKYIEQISQQTKISSQNKQTQKKKLAKKLQNEKQQNKKIFTQKQNLEKKLDQLINETNRLKNLIKNQQENFRKQEQQFREYRSKLEKELEEKSKKLIENQKNMQQQRQKIIEERRIYKQKIIMLETNQQQGQLQYAQCRQQLEGMIKDNTLLKKQIEQFTELYQEKIKEVQQMIDDIKKLQQQVTMKDMIIQQLQENQRITKQLLNNHERQLHQTKLMKQQYKHQLQMANKDMQKYKQIGVLNEEDINILKQQIQKVKNAYLQAEQQLDNVKKYCLELENQQNIQKKQKIKLVRTIQQLQNNHHNQRSMREKIDKQSVHIKDQLNLKNRQLFEKHKEVQDIKRDMLRMRKQLTEAREQSIKNQRESRQARQQLQKKREQDGLQTGKKKLELQSLKVELRRKTQQLEKQKQKYQQQLSIQKQKNIQLQDLITQKQALMRITNQHLTN